MVRLATHGLRRAAQIRPQAMAVSDARQRRTWRETEERVARLASALTDLGLRPGDRFAVLSDNSVDYFDLYWAAPWAGLILAHLNTRWAVAELADALADCDARLLLYDHANAATAEALAVGSSGRLRALEMDGHADGPWAERIAASEPMPDLAVGEHAPVFLFYTSGTTGKPKGATITAANIWSAGLMIGQPFNLSPRSVALCVMPMFHVGAGTFLIGLTFAASSIHIVPRFDANTTLAMIASERVTHSVLVPTMIAQLLDHPEAASRDLSSMQRLIYGAAPMPDNLIARAMVTMPSVGFNQGYSMTETTATGTCLLPEDHLDPARRQTVGQAVPGNDIMIRDRSGGEAATGETGEICIRGPAVMAGYWNRRDETAKVLQEDWLHTGDAGFMDADGYLHVVDRIKDMIISGGENVYSAEVENVLHDHPAVAECAVVGLPHPLWGEQVVAVVHLRAGQKADAVTLERHCRSRLGGYKVPRLFCFQRAALPKSATGKILKPEIRAGLAAQIAVETDR